MSQRAFLDDLDADIHAAFLSADMADQGQYTPESGAPVACDVYVDRSTQDIGDLGQLRGSRTEVAYLLRSMSPTVPAPRGVLVVDGETLTNINEISNDGSLSRWVVRRG